jgi:hypothetical protein
MIAGTVLFGVGFGALDTALNAHAARHFGARDINWMHASYGLGATLGPLLVTALLSAGRSWRQTYGVMALALAALGGVLVLAGRGSGCAVLHRRRDRHRVRRRRLGLPVPDLRA